jgi:molecular chaperone GrpE (heat shock protein)
MGNLDIRVAINNRGVARVQALGRDKADRERALKFITRILPALDQIDAATREKEAEPVEK